MLDVNLISLCFSGIDGGEEIWDIKSNIKLKCEKLGILLKRRSGDVGLFELCSLGLEGETQGKAVDFRVSLNNLSFSFSLNATGVYFCVVYSRPHCRRGSVSSSSRHNGKGHRCAFPPYCSYAKREGCNLAALRVDGYTSCFV